jgi:hypothetical protein
MCGVEASRDMRSNRSASGARDAAHVVPFEIGSGLGRHHPDLQYADRPAGPKKVRNQITVW